MPYTCGQDSTEPGESEQEHTEKRESTATDELPQKKKKHPGGTWQEDPDTTDSRVEIRDSPPPQPQKN